jgi:hypothetical protein
MPVTPGSYDRHTHTGQVILTGVTATVWSRRQADRLAASYGEAVDWTGTTWPNDVTISPGGLEAFARLGEAAVEFEAAVRACRELGERMDQAAVTRMIEGTGRAVGDY